MREEPTDLQPSCLASSQAKKARCAGALGTYLLTTTDWPNSDGFSEAHKMQFFSDIDGFFWGLFCFLRAGERKM